MKPAHIWFAVVELIKEIARAYTVPLDRKARDIAKLQQLRYT